MRHRGATAALVAGAAALGLLLSGCGEPWGPTDLPPDHAVEETPAPRRALTR